jgi:hypothetical protein
MGHAGGGGSADLDRMRLTANESRKRLKATRQLLGIGSSRAADPRMAARLRASQRAVELGFAIVDGPLDADISAVEKQRAALAALDATFPLQSGSVSLEIENVEGMSWKDMERLAASLLG